MIFQPLWESMIDPGASTEVLLYIFLSLLGLCLEVMAFDKLYGWSLRRYQRRAVRMKKRVTYRPSKVNGTFGVIWGGIFVLIGLFAIIPTFGIFGLLWTLAAAAMTGMNAYQTFGKHYAGPEINIEEMEEERPLSPPPAEDHNHIPSTALDAKRRLEQLESLKTAGLISGQEYQQKRQEILKEL